MMLHVAGVAGVAAAAAGDDGCAKDVRRRRAG